MFIAYYDSKKYKPRRGEIFVSCEGTQFIKAVKEVNLNINNEYKQKLLCIYGGFDLQQSSLIKMVLERENIKYYIKNELGSLMPTGAKTMELYVEEDNVEVCLNILKNELGLK